MGTFSARLSRVEPRTLVQQSAKAAGACPVCIASPGRVYESNGDYNPCSACDGTGSWDMFDCLTLNPRRVRVAR